MLTPRTIAAILAFAPSLPAMAALPPNAQRLAELRAIIDDRAVVGAFPFDQQIVRIEYVAPDRYRVLSARCSMDVRIVGGTMPRGMVGPRPFSVRAGAITCAGR